MSEPFDSLRDATDWANGKLGARHNSELLSHILTQIETKRWIPTKDSTDTSRSDDDIRSDVEQLAIDMYRIAHALRLNEGANFDRIVQVIDFIECSQACDTNDPVAVSHLAAKLYTLPDRDYLWLIGTNPSSPPLSPERIGTLFNRLNNENKWDLAHSVGMQTLEQRLNQRELLNTVRKLYASIHTLYEGWGYGCAWVYAPTGVSNIVKDVTTDKLVLPKKFPLSNKAQADETDRTVNRVAGILYKHACERLKAGLYGTRCKETLAAYTLIKQTLKPAGGAGDEEAKDDAPPLAIMDRR